MLAMEYRTHFDTFTGNAIVFTNRDETRESFFLLLVWEGRRCCSLVCLPRTVAFVKYAVNCVVVCVMSSFAVCLSKLPSLNHPRISDFTSSELQKTNLKTVFSTSNIILLAIKSIKIKVVQNGKGAHGGTVGWGTALPAGRLWVWFPVLLLELFVVIILVVAPWPQDSTQPLTAILLGASPGE